MNSLAPPPLTPGEKKLRVAWLAFLPAALVALALVDLGSLPAWFPSTITCGAMTGLPCIFCGTTRALHYLLHGEWGRALYYNWLAFPLLPGALGVAGLNTLELTLDRNFFACLSRPHLGRPQWSPLAVGFVLLWCFQVYLAVSQHKTELLNPRGPLYSLIVR